MQMLEAAFDLITAGANAGSTLLFVPDIAGSVFDKLSEFTQWADQGGAPLVWIGIGLILITTGVGLPTPEDIWLTLAGFMTYHSGFFGMRPGEPGFDVFHFAMALLYCALCNVIGDSTCWWLGRTYGLPIRDRFKLFKRLLSDRRYTKVKWWFRRYGNATVFIGRQMAGVRFVTFFTAGTVRMPISRFMLWDFIGCFVSIPVWFVLGSLGYVHQDLLREWFTATGGWMLLGGAVLVVGFVLFMRSKTKREAAARAIRLERRAALMAALPSGESSPAAGTLKETEREALKRRLIELEKSDPVDRLAQIEKLEARLRELESRRLHAVKAPKLKPEGT